MNFSSDYFADTWARQFLCNLFIYAFLTFPLPCISQLTYHFPRGLQIAMLTSPLAMSVGPLAYGQALSHLHARKKAMELNIIQSRSSQRPKDGDDEGRTFDISACKCSMGPHRMTVQCSSMIFCFISLTVRPFSFYIRLSFDLLHS